MSEPTSELTAYLCEYRHSDGVYGVEIMAASFADARDRMRNIGSSGRVCGPIQAKIRVTSLIGKILSRLKGEAG